MKLKVLVVDDNIDFAKEIKDTVEQYVSNITEILVEYEVLPLCDGASAYIRALNYIESQPQNIDILFADYDLTRGLGPELFVKVDPQYHPYKILYSITDKTLIKALRTNPRTSYDDLRERKSSQAVEEALEEFETNVLPIKLFGNPLFRSAFDKLSKSINKPEGIATFGNIPLQQILYAESLGQKEIKIVYRSDEFGTVKSLSRKVGSISDFVRSSFSFRPLTNGIAINPLWVAGINFFEKKVYFITSDNKVIELAYTPPEKFDNSFKPHLLDLGDGLHTYFRV